MFFREGGKLRAISSTFIPQASGGCKRDRAPEKKGPAVASPTGNRLFQSTNRASLRDRTRLAAEDDAGPEFSTCHREPQAAVMAGVCLSVSTNIKKIERCTTMNSTPPFSPSDRPRLRLVEELYVQADAARRAGRHLASNNYLRRAAGALGGSHQGWAAWALTQEARNKLHLHDNGGALQCVAAALAEVCGREEQAECAQVVGIVHKRRARDAWKRGEIGAAREYLAQALEHFERAYDLAPVHSHLLSLNAEQNVVYALGLKAAMEGKSREVNPGLLSRAVVLEYHARQWMCDAERNELTGLCMGVDLALGAGLRLREALDLVDYGREHGTVACARVLGHGERFWAKLILQAIDRSAVRPEVVVRALTLGAKTLLRQERADEIRDLLEKYALKLQFWLIELQSESQLETAVSANARQLIVACVRAGGFPPERLKRR